MQLSPDSTPSADFHERYQALRKKFVTGIPKRLLAIEAATCTSVRMQLLHQLAGAALNFEAKALGNLVKTHEVGLKDDFTANWPACQALISAEFRRLESETD